MKIGYIGLGKMGFNMVERLLENGHEIVAYNRSQGPVEEISKKGAIGTKDLENFFLELEKPIKSKKIIWLMVSWQAVDEILEKIIPFLEEGDLVIDGGNSPYFETIKRAEILKNKKIKFLDIGVSGGPVGARNGACLMIGGDKESFLENKKLFSDLSLNGNAFEYFGKSGAGHFVKMVHNGIEYGMMQSIGEGFEVLKKSEFDLDLKKVTEIYNNGSVIESRLIGWLEAGFNKYGNNLDEISGEIKHSGEGEWTIKTAKELNVPVAVIEESLEFRKKSVNNQTYTGKVVSVLRNMFGGHDVRG